MSDKICRVRLRCFLFLLPFSIGVADANDSWLDRSLATAHNSPWLIQYQFGFASDADFGPSLLFLLDQSQERTTLHSVSFGKKIADTFYGRHIEVSTHIGLQYFDERSFQNNIVGTTAFWKLSRQTYFPFTRIPIKLSLAQGLSYVADIPTAEVRDFEPANSAKLTHYLEYGLHYSFRHRLANNRSRLSAWFSDINVGYTIFHRSSVFGLFADTPGGINFPGIAIEFSLK